MTGPATPDQLFPGLFKAVQGARLFPDSKTFVDAVPRQPPARILRHYREQQSREDFDLSAFVRQHFALPTDGPEALPADPKRPLEDYIDQLWDHLTRRQEQSMPGTSLLPLPRPYIVPGGRFREIYYWDSYFTLLGLAEAGRLEMVEHMVENFAHLIDSVGFVPNGNRSYFCSRSQPPLFPLMVELLAECSSDPAVYTRYLPQLEREYNFWMAGADTLTSDGAANRRVVRLGDGLLNRYWDDSDEPRQESYAEDTALAAAAGRDPTGLYRDIRAACESGWDFSSRWLADPQRLDSIRTTSILPVDLNAILYRCESLLARAASLAGSNREALYDDRARKRLQLLRSRFFDREQGFFVDLLLPSLGPSGRLTQAAAWPLFFHIATAEQAAQVAARLERDFLRPGGWVTSCTRSGQQWDTPNGWAPLQWVTYCGLRHYGFNDQAQEGARRWVAANRLVYRSTGTLLEKYNVEEPGRLARGGEYAVQSGFGWTNGVLLKLLARMGDR